MRFMRSVRWLLLALIVLGAAALQQASAQIPVGTTRTGTFVWDGQQWLPVQAPPPPPAVVVEEAVPDGDDAVEVELAPPALPVYEQPPCPAPNLIWTPGHWRWGLFGYYWVSGVWVPAPYTGALWTPSYWGWSGGRFAYHEGYWGPHVGFYGGVNYGGGYMGIGFAGGAWNGGAFAYNTAVVHVNVNVVTNVYVNRTIVEQTTIVNTTNVSYNGGPNGVQHQATPDEQVAMHETHQAPTTFQQQHLAAAKADTSNLAKNNGGHPTKLAETKPLAEEKHAAPAGFKPPPARPVTELAKAEAPPATIAAAKAATTKNAAIKPIQPEPAPKPADKPAPPVAVKPAPPAPKIEPKPTPPPATKPVPVPETKIVPKPTDKTPAEPAVKPAPKPLPAPEPKVVPKLADKPPAEPAVKPAPKPGTTPPAKSDKDKKNPKDKDKDEKKPE